MLRLFGGYLARTNDKDANYYLQKAEFTRNSIRKKYLNGDSADNDTPSALGMALFFGIAEGEAALRMAARLAKKIADTNFTAPCGILGMKAIFGALGKYGHADTLYRMLTTEEYPSFGHWFTLGATSLWEDFEGKESRLHHMYASPMDFVLPYIGGIHAQAPGFARVRFAPFLYAERCSSHYAVKTKYGTLAIDWSYENGVFKANIQKPKRIEATLSVFGKQLPVTDGITSVTVEK